LDAFARTSGSVIFFYAVVYALTFTICLGVAFSNQARTAEQRTLELQRQKAQTALELSEQRMQTMQSQLSPHFLFNCLSSISFLARQAERDRLVAAIAKLGSLLRFTIENAAQPRIPLVEEVRFVEDYIGLQSLRFGERFQWTLVTDIEASSPVCPPFSIQPLVENVFRHAVERFTDESQSDPVRIELTVIADASSVEIRVCNTRTSDADQQTVTAGFGIGEKNLETRLKHTYGAGYSLESFKSGKAFCVELRFPPSQPEQVLTGI
jgi:LytS/YehU family sensor histidine kinase